MSSSFLVNPLTFRPLYMTRVWGGRTLETKYRRSLPDEQPYGESWELVDRPAEQSIVNDGMFAGRSLHDLWTEHRDEVFGDGFDSDRFPLLIKILDACDDLSIQVHPPADVAPTLGGEPKTEMWYIAGAEPGARLYAGLKRGVTREQFREAIASGMVADCVHDIEPRAGESIFIPSGRLHAIGAGLLIFEIQQNSDTTFRVFDWNRPGLDGRPRALHVEESLRCIDFNDHEPGMDDPRGATLASCPHFEVEKLALPAGSAVASPDPDRFSIVAVVAGALRSIDGRSFHPGDFVLLPRNSAALDTTADSVVLRTFVPNQQR